MAQARVWAIEVAILLSTCNETNVVLRNFMLSLVEGTKSSRVCFSWRVVLEEA